MQIVFLLAALNNLDILSGDIGNAYLNAPCAEKVHVTFGPELFGASNQGKMVVIVRALYDLKSASSSWRLHLCNTIIDLLRYKASNGYPDVFMKREVQNDGTEYYSYFVIYVDNILCAHEYPKSIIDKLGSVYRLKDGSIEKPERYLGIDMKSWTIQAEDCDKTECYAMSCKKYIKEAIRVVEKRMVDFNLSYPSTRRHGKDTPFSSSAYRPECEESEMCNENEITL